MIPQTVHILDLNTGNVSSVAKAFRNIGAEVVIIKKKEDVLNASHLVLPGIGHFGTVMKRLVQSDLMETTINHIHSNKPFLGICLGMQILAESSEEGNSTGLGIFKQKITKLEIEDFSTYKVPHSGWNTLEIMHDSPLLKGITATDEFFFLHKYCWGINEDETFAKTTYGQTFASIIGKEKCWGVQFHPEKSHQAGLKILQNFIEL